MRFLRRRPSLAAIGIAASLALAGSSGFLTASALGIGSAAPARTVTVNVATGPTGPAGPQGPAGPKGEVGPAGPSGSSACPNGYEAGALVINHPGGQTTIWTCLKD